MNWKKLGLGLIIAATLTPIAVLADEIVLKSGKRGSGTIVAENETNVEIETTVSGRKVKRVVPKNRIYSIEQGGKRRVLSESVAEISDDVAIDATKTRTPKEVVALIDRVGQTPPAWLATIPLDYPKTLDLSFPKDVEGWDNQRHFGQYIWDVVNPNPNRWKSAIKLAEFMRERNRDRPEVVRRIDQAIGEFYFRFFQDYARAAFYWRQSGLAADPNVAPWLLPYLGECYWKLGSKKMALDLFQKAPNEYPWIKILSDMGELDLALEVAERLAKTNLADFAFVYAGDACRTAGEYERALEYYRKVLAVEPTPQRTAEHMERNTKRARANIVGINVFQRLDLTKIPDGVYSDESVGFAGTVRVKVVVAQGKIASVEVVEHQEKQYYSSITDVPRQIVEKQSLKDVDAVSSATATSEAIVNATAKALAAGLERQGKDANDAQNVNR